MISREASEALLELVRFNSHGLLPAVVQDSGDNTVLMVAYMNRESLGLTLATGYTHFYSRSRQKIWKKGEESGNIQKVTDIRLDCDFDTVLVKVVQENDTACHTGNRSCFFNRVTADGAVEQAGETGTGYNMLQKLYDIILERKAARPENSYTTYLYDKGQDKILKKVGEEAGEVIIASKNMDRQEIISETADLWFHCIVMLGLHEISPVEIMKKFAERHLAKKQAATDK